MFETPFNVQPSDVPDNLQMEIIELQNNNELKAKYNNLSLLDFYKLYVRAEDFPILRRHSLKFASLFGTTYRCEQFFSKLTLVKTRLRSRLTDSNLENQLRVASSHHCQLTSDASLKKKSSSHRIRMKRMKLCLLPLQRGIQKGIQRAWLDSSRMVPQLPLHRLTQ
ncbi:general transcription factor II-I repeat domain-containing protein 2B-like [Acanthochromis polyacanthus]|uniref:general transcription factor II-I repeat domain-containing protein 2B-like n=1 Tax=Acanthochromis polyacanthus TaxID=80966 RepID=UPI002234897E|nr:general transcription factor II-I repeat domain-containing protein 2B-like [Acanthochromis polyacanthus]